MGCSCIGLALIEMFRMLDMYEMFGEIYPTQSLFEDLSLMEELIENFITCGEVMTELEADGLELVQIFMDGVQYEVH